MKNGEIQKVLAKSYMSYFVFITAGLFLDILIDFSVKIPSSNIIAILFLSCGTLLIFWAQLTTGKKIHKENSLADFFNEGPYKYLRNPSHLGFVLLVTGYTAISGSISFLVGTVFGYIVSSFYFRKYEKILIKKSGEDYKEYKNKVPKIL